VRGLYVNEVLTVAKTQCHGSWLNNSCQWGVKIPRDLGKMLDLLLVLARVKLFSINSFPFDEFLN